MKDITQTMRLKLFIKRFKEEVKIEHIRYDWDGGHAYSHIDHPIITEVCESDLTEDMKELFELQANEWMYEQDQLPPCGIHIYKDGRTTSGCGCHNNNYNYTKEELDNIIEQLTEAAEVSGSSIDYLITRE